MKAIPGNSISLDNGINEGSLAQNTLYDIQVTDKQARVMTSGGNLEKKNR